MLERAAQVAVLRHQAGQRVAALAARLEMALGRGAGAAFGHPREARAAVRQGAQLFVAQMAHVASPVRARRRCRSSARARDSRDITVPTGTFSARAISS